MGSFSRDLGQRGFKRIADTLIHHADFQNVQDGNGGTDDGSNTYHPNVQKWFAVKIMGTVVFNASGTEMYAGDIPGADTFIDGDVIQGPFKKIQLTSGVVYAYID